MDTCSVIANRTMKKAARACFRKSTWQHEHCVLSPRNHLISQLLTQLNAHRCKPLNAKLMLSLPPHCFIYNPPDTPKCRDLIPSKHIWLPLCLTPWRCSIRGDGRTFMEMVLHEVIKLFHSKCQQSRKIPSRDSVSFLHPAPSPNSNSNKSNCLWHISSWAKSKWNVALSKDTLGDLACVTKVLEISK